MPIGPGAVACRRQSRGPQGRRKASRAHLLREHAVVANRRCASLRRADGDDARPACPSEDRRGARITAACHEPAAGAASSGRCGRRSGRMRQEPARRCRGARCRDSQAAATSAPLLRSPSDRAPVRSTNPPTTPTTNRITRFSRYRAAPPAWTVITARRIGVVIGTAGLGGLVAPGHLCKTASSGSRPAAASPAAPARRFPMS